MAKLVLSLSENEFDFGLLAICSHIKDYRIGWEINRYLNLDLQRIDDLELKTPLGITSFSFFSCFNEDTNVSVYLLANRSEGGLLIPEKKQVDFFLIIKEADESYHNEVLLELKKTPNILAAYAINPSELKSKNNLLF
ncbi:hypothetical protein FLAV_00625 [Flavobacteriales bacterium]|nr:hypothetical protein [Flavobacteriales bacterium]MCL4815406.1 IPExxxVDY family protein [Flavobacteriales bacterium]WKZ75025.1 MAG: IPExxxVDY family protein [Vicingaceae bacterium]GIK69967.1 MAG: hypothetical protein BroJett020_12620 [Bacteroidota bacterium]CAG0959563.1 hypothetical protein FLAV_00625 [Flavobacteriales bacterium]